MGGERHIVIVDQDILFDNGLVAVHHLIFIPLVHIEIFGRRGFNLQNGAGPHAEGAVSVG